MGIKEKIIFGYHLEVQHLARSLPPLANRPKLSKMNKYCCVEFCASGNVARTAQTVGMDQVVCPECAEVVFIRVSMVCDHVVLQFRLGGACWKARKYSHH